MRVRLRNDLTGQLKEVKIGFSWTLLFFSGMFGIPLFLRGLNQWAEAFLAFSIASVIILFVDNDRAISVGNAIGLISVSTSVFLGFKGNQITAKSLLKKGWSFADNDQVTQFAKTQWSLA